MLNDLAKAMKALDGKKDYDKRGANEKKEMRPPKIETECAAWRIVAFWCSSRFTCSTQWNIH